MRTLKILLLSFLAITIAFSAGCATAPPVAKKKDAREEIMNRVKSDPIFLLLLMQENALGEPDSPASKLALKSIEEAYRLLGLYHVVAYSVGEEKTTGRDATLVLDRVIRTVKLTNIRFEKGVKATAKEMKETNDLKAGIVLVRVCYLYQIILDKIGTSLKERGMTI